MRRLLLALLLAACREAPPADPDVPVDSGEALPDVVCARWTDFSCVEGAQGCVAECWDAGSLQIRMSCERRHCGFQGVGQGSGRGCTISADDRKDGCGLCQTAHRECYVDPLR